MKKELDCVPMLLELMQKGVYLSYTLSTQDTQVNHRFRDTVLSTLVEPPVLAYPAKLALNRREMVKRYQTVKHLGVANITQ